jgi:hypothetical protein
MKALKAGVLAALVLVSAVVVVASPAFATPNITASSGSGAVAPFITPIGNTTNSSINGVSTDSGFVFVLPGGIRMRILCADSTARGYVVQTHTRGLVTSLTFSSCTSGLGGAVTVATSASSTRPWFLHVRSSSGDSSTGSVEIPSSGSATITTSVPRCTIVFSPQSIFGTFTHNSRSLVINDPTMAFTLTAGSGASCPSPATPPSQFGSYTLRPSTARDDIGVTPAS